MPIRRTVLFTAILLVPVLGCQPGEEPAAPETDVAIEWGRLSAEAETLGKPEWRPMLTYLADLHRRSTRPAGPPFPYPWVELGPGYHARAFGHWDIVHATLDLVPTLPQHAERQILNNLANQEADGLVPGVIWVERPNRPDEGPGWSTKAGHPPLWPIAVEDLSRHLGSDDVIASAYGPLARQIAWFEQNRRGEPQGFYYSRTAWESGLDDDLRQPHAIAQDGTHWAFLDATSHVYSLYIRASEWATRLLRPGEASGYLHKAGELQAFVREDLWDPEAGFFYDIWSFEDPARRVESLVAIWPLVVGIATTEQADRVIDEHLLNPDRFFGAHPIATIAMDSPGYQRLTWRGPTWNSMSYWAARGCVRYGRKDAALQILEKALDSTARQFERTGTIWEFYDPRGGPPEELEREVTPPAGTPKREYLGHNPLLAMARLYDELTVLTRRSS